MRMAAKAKGHNPARGMKPDNKAMLPVRALWRTFAHAQDQAVAVSGLDAQSNGPMDDQAMIKGDDFIHLMFDNLRKQKKSPERRGRGGDEEQYTAPHEWQRNGPVVNQNIRIVFFAFQHAAFKRPLQRSAVLLIFFFIVFVALWTFISSIFFLEFY